MRLLVFGYERDHVPDGATVVDCRGLRNPDRVDGYRALTGADPQVQLYVIASNGFLALWADVVRLLDRLPDDAVVAFGCAWGKHRSRALAYLVKAHLEEEGRPVDGPNQYVWNDGRVTP